MSASEICYIIPHRPQLVKYYGKKTAKTKQADIFARLNSAIRDMDMLYVDSGVNEIFRLFDQLPEPAHYRVSRSLGHNRLHADRLGYVFGDSRKQRAAAH